MSLLPIEELKQLPEFTLLPETRQRFLEAYIANGYDGATAIKACYPKAKEAESIRVMASRALNSPGVVMLLQLHYGDDPRDSFCKMVAKMIMRGRISKEQSEMMRLLAQVHGFVDPWSPRLEKKIEAGKSDSREAMKKRAQRAARREEPAESQNLLGDFKNL
jgi:hypothetical protein